MPFFRSQSCLKVETERDEEWPPRALLLALLADGRKWLRGREGGNGREGASAPHPQRDLFTKNNNTARRQENDVTAKTTTGKKGASHNGGASDTGGKCEAR